MYYLKRDDLVPTNDIERSAFEEKQKISKGVFLSTKEKFEEVIFANQRYGDRFQQAYFIFYQKTPVAKTLNSTTYSHLLWPSREMLVSLSKQKLLFVCPDRLDSDIFNTSVDDNSSAGSSSGSNGDIEILDEKYEVKNEYADMQSSDEGAEESDIEELQEEKVEKKE